MSDKPPATRRKSEAARHAGFYSRVLIDLATGCWHWTGYIRREGYGQYDRGLAHRYAYEMLVGPIPDGMHTDHLCRVRDCVNPRHLEVVTPAENIRRGYAVRPFTHCKRGHEMTGDNVFTVRQGRHRQCRTCHNMRGAAWKSRRKSSNSEDPHRLGAPDSRGLYWDQY